MELAAATRFESIGKDLFSLGDVHTEISRAKDQNTQRMQTIKKLRQLQKSVLEIEERERATPFRRVLVRYIPRFAKGFVVGWGGQSVFFLIGHLMKSRGKLDSARLLAMGKGVMAPAQLRMGVFLGSALCVFNLVMRLLRFDKGWLGEYRSVIAAFLASYCLKMVKSHDNRVGIGLFFWVRALDMLSRFIVAKGVFSNRVVAFAHYDVALMCVAGMQVVWGGLMSRGSMNTSYVKFLDKHAGIPLVVREALAQVLQTGAVPFRHLQDVNINRTARALHKLKGSEQHLSCKLLHPTSSSCHTNLPAVFMGAILRSIPVYVPVYILPLLLFRPHVMVNQPLTTAVSVLKGVLRSSTFLAAFGSVGWYAIDVILRYTPLQSPLVPVLAGAIGGLSVLIEKKSRRLELALYVGTHGFQSFWRTWRDFGLLPKLADPGVTLFSLSMAMIMYVYTNKPELVKSTYFRPLNFLFGSDFATWASSTAYEQQALSHLDLPSLLRDRGWLTDDNEHALPLSKSANKLNLLVPPSSSSSSSSSSLSSSSLKRSLRRSN